MEPPTVHYLMIAHEKHP